MNSVADVLANRARWSVSQGDCLEWLRSLPDDSVDLLVTSPPYLQARTYSHDGVSRKIDEWVPWMVSVVRAAAPKVKGLIAINCEGQTRQYAYLPAPFLLLADLYREGFNLRKPCVFQRYGIPGSGGPDYLRNDWEPVIVVTRPGKLPWSDNTACGHPPVYSPGGAMSNRMADGRRVTSQTRRKENGERVRDGAYKEPEIANPGNVIDCGAVGGGLMGHELAHENEAPFPLELPEFFVKSFCPPDGVVCDPFSGSGTTCHAAVGNGRRFIGVDLRQSQVELCGRRMATVTLPLFAA